MTGSFKDRVIVNWQNSDLSKKVVHLAGLANSLLFFESLIGILTLLCFLYLLGSKFIGFPADFLFMTSGRHILSATFLSSKLPIGFELLLPEVIVGVWSIFLMLLYITKYDKVKSNSSVLLWKFISSSVWVLLVCFTYSSYLFMSFYYYSHCLYFKGFVFDFYTFTMKAALMFLIVLALSSALVYYSGYQKDYMFELPVMFFFLSFFLLFLCSCFNFISMFVCTEGMTFCLAALMIHNYGYDDASYAGMKYLILGSLASGMFMFGAVLLFGLSGTTNFFWTSEFFKFGTTDNVLKEAAADALKALGKEEPYYNTDPVVVIFKDADISNTMSNVSSVEALGVAMAIVFLLLGFFFKLSMAPMHQWTLDIYPVLNWGLLLLFSIVVKLAFFSVLVSCVFYVFYSMEYLWLPIFGICGLLSLFFGSFGGVNASNFKEFLAYSSLAQLGFIMVGLLVVNINAYASASLFFLYYVLSMLLILLVCTFYSFFIDLKSLEIDSTHLATRAAESSKESTTFSLLSRGSSAARLEVSSKVIFGLNSLRLFSQKPLLAFVLSVAVLNLAGVPPMPGFFAKFFVLMALIGAGYYYYAALSLFLSLLSVFYYMKVLMLFWMDFTSSGNLMLGVQQALNSNSAMKKSHTSGLNSFEEGGDNIFASSLKYFIYEEKNKYIFAVLSLVMLFLSGSLFFMSTMWTALLFLVAKGVLYYI